MPGADRSGPSGALFVTGPVGVGRTTVADAVGDLPADAGVAHPVIDLDRLRRCRPSPADDAFNLAIEIRNPACVARDANGAGLL